MAGICFKILHEKEKRAMKPEGADLGEVQMKLGWSR